MKPKHVVGAVAFVALIGCASYPPPIQSMADAEAAARAAQETGATSIPQAQLHLRLAREEIAQAKQFVNDGDNRRADTLLLRAKGDAELALSEARAQQAQASAQKAVQDLAAVQTKDTTAPSTSITTTTSATTTAPAPTPAPATTTTTTTTIQEGKP